METAKNRYEIISSSELPFQRFQLIRTFDPGPANREEVGWWGRMSASLAGLKEQFRHSRVQPSIGRFFRNSQRLSRNEKAERNDRSPQDLGYYPIG
jgi:hypothetical protein